MMAIHAINRKFSLILILVMLINNGSTALAQNTAVLTAKESTPGQPVVAQVYYHGTDDLNQLASYLDVWEVNHKAGYLVAMLSPEQYASLQLSGYRLVIDKGKTDLLSQPLIPLPGQGPDSIPSFPCYRTVEEDYASMEAINTAHPELAELIDIGDSWDKSMPGSPAGYDIYALRLTNENMGVIDDKPTFFLIAEIHARELVTAETAMRYAEYLIANYGIDPDITWLLDYFRVNIVTMTNPDGRKLAEQGKLWRKNVDNNDGCFFSSSWGTDLNRNHTFKWNNGGSSPYPCNETYRGPSAGSEPEVQAIEAFVTTLFPDQRGTEDTDPAPADTTGLFISLHSAAGLVLWPWGWSSNPAPNSTQLQTLGRHLAYFNNYTPQQSYQLYQTSGTSDEFAYGELGIAGYTFEMGTDFFQDCGSFETTIYPDNRESLLYAFKASRQPYMNPAGPDTLSVSVTFNTIPAGTPVELTATANDTRYKNTNGTEPTQYINEARYTIDDPSWITGTIAYPMAAGDGNFNNPIEAIQATVDTGCLSEGRHTIFVESKDDSGNWGVPTAVFLNITDPVAPIAEFTSNSPVFLGQPMQFINKTTGADPKTYAWNFGDGIGISTETNPVYMYGDPGAYMVTLISTNTFCTNSITHTVNVFFSNFLPLITR